ncbi:hypothetical protein [Streptomyces canus]
MTSENTTENEAVESAAVSAKAVDDQLLDNWSSTVSSAWSWATCAPP